MNKKAFSHRPSSSSSSNEESPFLLFGYTSPPPARVAASKKKHAHKRKGGGYRFAAQRRWGYEERFVAGMQTICHSVPCAGHVGIIAQEMKRSWKHMMLLKDVEKIRCRRALRVKPQKSLLVVCGLSFFLLCVTLIIPRAASAVSPQGGISPRSAHKEPAPARIIATHSRLRYGVSKETSQSCAVQCCE